MQFHLQWATEHLIFAKEKKSSSVPKNCTINLKIQYYNNFNLLLLLKISMYYLQLVLVSTVFTVLSSILIYHC